MTWQQIVKGIEDKPTPILDYQILLSAYCPLNLSITNPDLKSIDIADPAACQRYIDRVLRSYNATVAYGGYLERRKLYQSSNRFSQGPVRDLHLGIDFWCKAGTQVLAPIDGLVHSFANNADLGNYGPTIIMKHQFDKNFVYTLYGHLSLSSLEGLHENKPFKKGEVLGYLGTPDINVNYAPHLHFQLINNLEDYKGDYLGVCHVKDMEFYQQNCPDPNLLLKM